MDLLIESMRPEEIPEVSTLLGKTYISVPLIITALGANPHRCEAMMRLMLDKLPGNISVAKDNGLIVGAMRYVNWPGCLPQPLKKFLMMPRMLKACRGSTPKVLKWLSVWEKHDPRQPHWHIGALGVLPERQGQGIGSQLLTCFCEHVDRLGAASYLETEKPENVRLYQRFGFEVVEEDEVIGVSSWFMWRSPQPKE